MAKKSKKAKPVAKKRMSGKAKLGIATGMIAAVAGVYFFSGKKNAKHRAQAAHWAVKVKRDILEHLRNYEEIGENHYHQAIEEVAARYGAAKDVDPDELTKVVRDLKKNWVHVKKQFSANVKAERAAQKKVKKPATKAKKAKSKKRK